MIAWRCAGLHGCDEPLSGGEHGPYLEAVVAHLRERHGDVSVLAAWDRFRHRRGEARRPVEENATATGALHPATSHAAAARVLPRAGSDRRRVLDLIAERGERGATDDEIEVVLGLPHQTASARRNGLRDDGWLRDSGRRRPTRTGAEAIVWVACR